MVFHEIHLARYDPLKYSRWKTSSNETRFCGVESLNFNRVHVTSSFFEWFVICKIGTELVTCFVSSKYFNR